MKLFQYIQCSKCHMLQTKQFLPWYFCLDCGHKIGQKNYIEPQYSEVNFAKGKYLTEIWEERKIKKLLDR